MKKVLLLEDDKTLGSSLQERLSKIYHVDWASTLHQAREFLKLNNAKVNDYDLAILDVGLPDGSGFDFAKFLREQSNASFLFLTAQADAEHRLLGFEIGATEYIPKPFHLKELLIRAEHVLKEHIPLMREIELSDCTINLEEQKITYKDGRIEFPAVNEIKLLKLLINNSPKILSRDEIIDALWGIDKVPSPRSIDNMIVHLRQLIGRDEALIRSVRGVGYQWQKRQDDHHE
jgi:DNA-binding response OmpR family regulator